MSSDWCCTLSISPRTEYSRSWVVSKCATGLMSFTVPSVSSLSAISLGRRVARIQDSVRLRFSSMPHDRVDIRRMKWRRWRSRVRPRMRASFPGDGARLIVNELPGDQTGTCVLTRTAELFTGDAQNLRRALMNSEVLFHAGRL